MLIDNAHWLNLAVALGIGLLIGAERERSKADGGDRTIAGVRTFTIASLLGAVSTSVNFWLLVVSIICVTVFVATAYFTRRDEDPGLTTEISLVFTVILGGLAMTTASMAASLAVAAAILLAAKDPIHGFVRGVVTKDEMIDFLILAAATLIVLPLVPNALVGPFDAINPRNLWLIVILVMFIGALGHLALRLLGSRTGLPLVGLVSGFISSIATIGAMGARVRKTPDLIGTAVAGATLSSLSTVLQLVMLLAAIHPPTLHALKVPLLFGGLTIALYGLVITLNSFNHQSQELSKPSRSFSVKTALTLALVIAVVLIASAALKAWFGQAGLVVASAVAGLADVHASTISAASLAASNKITAANAAVPILVAFSANALSKVITAAVTGGKVFFQQVTLGLVLQVSAIWLGWWLF
ncbi:MgtC/SapB family protein [Methylotenera sp.]|uniref:MgtC/SapB family protein n=1 Tax=Methylotenera sp. TaxID=2051956 RepID=UPI002735D7C9|nr:MgtC/SapB family protein [Methylotenera sp.]MDP3778135.1 MgtC/SapB family protein [Methylotenera sp.]